MRDACRQFEERLDAFIGGSLPPDEQLRFQRHADGCRRCGDLLAVVLGRTPEPTDVVAPVVAATTGGACAPAQELLCDHVDATLVAGEAALLRSHLEHCAGCERLATVLGVLNTELPRMATLTPDADFVADVLRLTSSAVVAPAPAGRATRLARLWQDLLRRPRFAWEVAWVGTAILLLLMGGPRSPWSELPRTALAFVQTDPVAVWRESAPVRERAWGWVRDDVEGLWEASGGEVLQRAGNARQRWTREHPQATSAWESLQQRLPELRQAVRDGNLGRASWVLTGMGEDMKELWHGMRANPAEGPEAQPRPDREENP